MRRKQNERRGILRAWIDPRIHPGIILLDIGPELFETVGHTRDRRMPGPYETENRKEIDMKTESEVRGRIYSELNQMGFWIDERENVKRKKPVNPRVKMPRINERLFQLCCWILRND